LAPQDIPVPYHPDLLDAVIPTVARIAARIQALMAV
jgi:2-oxoisovalerate dehydrogenase E1 component